MLHVSLLGRDDAVASCLDAIKLARAIDHPYSLAVALAYGSITHQMRHDVPGLTETVGELRDLCDRYGFACYREWALIPGRVVAARGDADARHLRRRGCRCLAPSLRRADGLGPWQYRAAPALRTRSGRRGCPPARPVPPPRSRCGQKRPNGCAEAAACGSGDCWGPPPGPPRRTRHSRWHPYHGIPPAVAATC
jgi:hypothetical protein